AILGTSGCVASGLRSRRAAVFSAVTHERFDLIGGASGVVMLPNADRDPPPLDEPPVGVGIASLGASDLAGPVPRVDGGLASARFGATVPEATIHEDSNPRRLEREVDCAARSRHYSSVKPIAQPSTVEFAAQR